MIDRFVAAGLVLLLPAVLPPQDYTEQLTRLIELTDNKDLRGAIDGYKQLAADEASPQWLKAASHYEIAELAARLGDAPGAVAALRQAIQLGFDDCQTPSKSAHLAPVLKHSNGRELIEQIALTESDYREMIWLQAEVGHAEHDARMMITENINRVDQQETVVPQAPIPSRPTTSAGVLYWRQQLRLMQAAQHTYVRKSDQERMAHAATMQIAGGGGNTGAMQESARQAHARAASRRLEIARRAFKAPPEGGATIRPCSGPA